ncbi:uncharacterized protein [Gossypium hirsutum]|uniref:Gag-pro-like protein n=1 Tax=Gossypium hirsutum TaxID=3635 RepID=A0ABM3A749_GOSHI|nr:uncharacterized protein LOC107887904 [Gossypium hirsutum]
MAGEMIENAVRGGKIKGEMAKRSAPRRKDNEVNSLNSRAVTIGQPKAEQLSTQRQESSTRQNSEKIQFTPIPVTYRELYQSLYDAHAIGPFHLKPLQPPFPKWYDANAKCEYYAGIPGHSIENCTGFKKVVERLIKMGVVKFDSTPNTENPLPDHGNQGVNAIDETREGKIKEDIAKVKIPMKGSSGERQICVLGNERQETHRPRIIISLPGNNEVGAQIGPRVVIHKPNPFPYKDEKRVPWSYDCSIAIPEGESIASASRGVQNEGSHTRSGKRYDGGSIRVEPVKMKDVEVEREKEMEVPINEPVKEEEAKEFIKFLKHSEYSVVEQLHKQPACISVLALLLSFDVYRDALLKVLNETYVTHDISVNKLDRLVNNICADNFIYFNDDEIPPGGVGSTKSLHITTQCKGYTLPSVLIDNGSALNVLLLSTLNRLPIDSSHMKTCHNVVRAFDGTERKVMGRIDIPLEIGPNTYEVDFLVMDIKPSNNYLLGRPWIHSVGAVPSSLHQKLKLVTEGRLITINAEEDIIAEVTSKAPYVEASEEAIECSFRSLEIINATFILEGNEMPVPKMSRATMIAL